MAVLCSRCRVFEADDEPITCVLFEGGPCSACKERAAIRNRIQQLEDEIAELKAKHDILTTPMNAIHDPFIHKLPPEICSHIFRLSSSRLTNDEHLEAIINPWNKSPLGGSAKILRLGGVCRMWRQLAWATPDLWDALYVRTGMGRPELDELLPELVREWLERSGSLPLTIFFNGYKSVGDESGDYDDTVAVGNGLIVEILNLHSHRWRILNLTTTAPAFRRFSGSIQPNQLVGLGLEVAYQSSDPSPPKFLMESELTPSHLMLDFPLTSVNVRWDNITHVTIPFISAKESINILRRASSLEYYDIHIYQPSEVSFRKPILHPRLRSLHLSTSLNIEKFLREINVPSIEEWTHDSIHNGPLPVSALLSVFKRSGCHLKILHLTSLLVHSEGLNTIL